MSKQAKKILEEQGYQVENLWNIADVKGNFNCTDEEAMNVLIGALQNEATMEQIWYAISSHAEENGLEQKNK